MGYKIFYEMNPFFVVFLLFVFLFILKAKFVRRTKPDYIGLVIKIGLIFNLTALISFELYFHHFKCRVSNNYYEKNLRVARRMMILMNRQNVSYWLDFATLLNQLRNEAVSPWDHDIDFSIIDPDYSDALTNTKILRRDKPSGNQKISPKMRQLMNFYESNGFFVSYDETRHLIQLWADPNSTQGPHVDLWLWIPQLLDDQTILLWTVDLDVHYNPRPISNIFPLKKATWINQDSFIPSDSHLLSRKEYETYPGHYLIARTGRTDCVHNLFYGRFLY